MQRLHHNRNEGVDNMTHSNYRIYSPTEDTPWLAVFYAGIGEPKVGSGSTREAAICDLAEQLKQLTGVCSIQFIATIIDTAVEGGSNNND